MLSVAKLALGQEAYDEQQDTLGLDDYYAGRGELPGLWAGSGAEGFTIFRAGSPFGPRVRSCQTARVDAHAPGSGVETPASEARSPRRASPASRSIDSTRGFGAAAVNRSASWPTVRTRVTAALADGSGRGNRSSAAGFRGIHPHSTPAFMIARSALIVFSTIWREDAAATSSAK